MESESNFRRLLNHLNGPSWTPVGQGGGTARHLRYKFWMWVHDRLEAAWHWVYRKKVRPLEPTPPPPDPVFYHKEFENEDITIYRY